MPENLVPWAVKESVAEEKIVPWAADESTPAPSLPKRAPSTPSVSPTKNGKGAILSLFPDAYVTDWKRDPSSPLGRKNPGSWHNKSEGAVDIRRIPGMTFSDYVSKIREAGYPIIEARDEYENPSPHATGPHWHVTIGEREGAAGPVSKGTEKLVPWETAAEAPSQPFVPKMNRPAESAPFPIQELDKSTWDSASGKDVPEGYSVVTEYEQNSRNYFSNSLESLSSYPKGKRPTREQFIADIRKNAPAITTDDATLSHYYNSYAAGKPIYINYKAGEQKDPIDEMNPLEGLPFADKFQRDVLDPMKAKRDSYSPTGDTLAAPPPLTPGEVLQRKFTETLDPAGTGINAGILRGIINGTSSEEDKAKLLAKWQERRQGQEQFWNDQGERTTNPIMDEVAKLAGETGGSVTPLDILGPGIGKTVLGRVLGAGGANAAEDVVSQTLEGTQGLREQYDPIQTATAAAGGAALQGAVFEPLGMVIKRYAGKSLATETFDNPRVVGVNDTPTGPAPRGKVNKKQASVAAEVAKATEGWADSPEIVVHGSKGSFTKAEPVLAEKLRADKAENRASGFYGEDGRIHVLAYNVKDVANVKSLVFHEALGHAGLAKSLGGDLDNILNDLYARNPTLRREADALGAGQYKGVYTGDDALARLTEEVLAKRSENGVISTGILDKFRAAIAPYVRKLGLTMDLSNAEVKAILADAHSMITKGGKAADGTTPSGLKYMYTGLRGATEKENSFRRDEIEVSKEFGMDSSSIEADLRNNAAPDSYDAAITRAEAGEDIGPGSLTHLETGWFRGPDGRWREEISDNRARLKQGFRELEPNQVAKLSDYLDHPELYTRYPEIRDLELTRDPDLLDFFKNVQGWMNEAGTRINITPYAEDIFGTLLHEVQHKVQQLEGFSTGGNPGSALRRLSPKHLSEVSRKVADYYKPLVDDFTIKAKAHLVAADDPMFARYAELNEAIGKSYDLNEPVEKRWPLVEEKTKVLTELFNKYTGMDSLELKKVDKASYEEMWTLLSAAHGKTSLLDAAADYSQKADRGKALIRDIRSNINSDGSITDKDHLVKTLSQVDTLGREAYEQLFGEVEARDTSNRRLYDDEDRKEVTPYTSEKGIDPTGYVFDNGMNGYGDTKSVSPKYMLEDDLPQRTVKKFMTAMKGARILQKKYEADVKADAKEKMTALRKARGSSSGEAGLYTELAALKGKTTKPVIEPFREKFSQKEAKALFDLFKNDKKYQWFESLNARIALKKLFDGEVPTKGELDLLARVLPKDFIKYALEMRTVKQKLGDAFIEGVNIPRALMASVDLSAPFRQGLFLVSRGAFWKNFPSMFRHAWSQEFHDAQMAEIRSRENYPLMQKANLALTEMGSEAHMREEDFMATTPEKWAGIGRLVKGSNRAYTGFLNQLRADVFDDIVKTGMRKGVDFNSDVKALKSLGGYINDATGRASLGKRLDKHAPLLNAVFFSARLIASRVKLLTNLANPLWYANTHPLVRAQYFRDLIGFGSIAVSLAALADFGGADVEWDPRSSDFLKIRVGKTRYDIFGGFSQYMTLAARLSPEIVGGNHTKTLKGEVKKLNDGPYGPGTRGDVTGRFLRNKLAPVPSYIADFLFEKNPVGEEFHPGKDALKRVVPLFIQDLKKGYDEEGYTGIAKALPSGLGIGSSTYDQVPAKYDPLGRDPEAVKDGDPVSTELDRLSKLNEDERPVIGWVTKANLPKGPVRDAADPKDIEALQKLSGDYIYADLKQTMESPEWKEMTDEEKVELVNKIEKDQRKNAREDLFPEAETEEKQVPWTYADE